MRNLKGKAKLHLMSALLFTSSLLIGGVTMAQNANANSAQQAETKEKTQLEKDVEIANQKKAIAEAQKAEAEALKAVDQTKLPSTESKGLTGTVTVNQGAGYYAEILSYDAMNDCAEEIASQIRGILGSAADTLIILTQTNLTEELALFNLLQLKVKDANAFLDRFIEDYTKIPSLPGQPKPQRLGFLAAAPSILGAASDIAAFFKSDREITSRTITLNEQALLSVVARTIHSSNGNLRIILPKIRLTENGMLFRDIQNLLNKRNQLLEIKRDSISKIESEIFTNANELSRFKTKKIVQNKIIEKAIADNKNTDDFIKTLEEIDIKIDILGAPEHERTSIITSVDKVISIIDDLIKTITEKTPDKLSPLERVATIEQIKSIDNAKILYLQTVSQGGEIETSKSAFTSARISYIGGAVISYTLTDPNGTYLLSGNISKIRKSTFKRGK